MRVGTSEPPQSLRQCKEDHPHACGDKLQEIRSPSNHLGSSPCVWGQAALCRLRTLLPGIIPMRVGTRDKDDTTTDINKDHPHACGDKQGIKQKIPNKKRIIPMRVGTSFQGCSCSTQPWDHPHACGDKA